LADLGGERRLGDVKLLGRAGQVALLGDYPEIVQMMEIEVSHNMFT
jgi:hypothetical protein